MIVLNIALASVISKLVEVIMLDRTEMYMNTNPNQFGFKRKHGTEQCIYVLKEIIDLCRRLNGSVCFLDASNAFDRVGPKSQNVTCKGILYCEKYVFLGCETHTPSYFYDY